MEEQSLTPDLAIGIPVQLLSNRLEKTYYEKFKKILSNKKIYLVQRAEMRFNRELLKGMHHKGGEPQKPQGKKR